MMNEQELNKDLNSTHLNNEIRGRVKQMLSSKGFELDDESLLNAQRLILDMSDLRKKQGKTVVDAVNELEATCPCGYVNYSIDENVFNLTDRSELASHLHRVCTAFEFDQCVKDMAEARWMNKGGDFFCYESYKEDYQESTKPRMKVEYVRVADSIFHLQPDLEAGGLYCNTCDGYEVIDKELTLMSQLYKMNVYRKVETEIKTEKRWVIVTDIAYKELYTSIEDAEAYAFHMGLKPQYIEITVEV